MTEILFQPKFFLSGFLGGYCSSNLWCCAGDLEIEDQEGSTVGTAPWSPPCRRKKRLEPRKLSPGKPGPVGNCSVI